MRRVVPETVREPLSPPGRCAWAESGSSLMQDYHDREWGVPVHEDVRLFEFLVLEAAQAGLSWATVLRKRARYRVLYAGFDPQQVARFDARRRARLLADPGIIRNRAKIEASIDNARHFLELQDAFGSFDAYLWTFVDGRPRQNSWQRPEQVPASTPESEALSKDLRRRGFRFVGPTICYAYMQAVGMVNDHLTSCFRHAECH